eukprot:TRINITY_DN14462_c0_g1_i1.p2 TRINITY_DN14462_c0_g1~~TRINITY_DN14462_c0_g1_i1.p2  ORF type:complete len:123 (-),score=7.86 TRINITY_DN14462_c0_g1_i1:26-394(-)
MLQAGLNRTEHDRKKPREIGQKDDPDRAVERGVSEGQLDQQKDHSDRQDNPRQGVGQIKQTVENPRKARPAAFHQPSQWQADHHQRHGGPRCQTEGVGKGPCRDRLAKQDLAPLIKCHGIKT